MRAAQLARLGDLMALARQVAELRLAGLKTEIARAGARRSELEAARSQPVGADAFARAGELTAEIAWRRGLKAQIATADRQIAELSAAAGAARGALRLAVGRELAAARLTSEAATELARQAERKAEDQAPPRLPARR